MRTRTIRSALPLGPLLATAVLVLPAAIPGALFAQTAAPAGAPAAPAKDAPKQIPLTQQKIDKLIVVQKKVDDYEKNNQPKGAPDKEADAKMQKAVEGIIKANGFASVDEFADTNFSISMVLSGMDPDGNDYIGTAAALQKEAASVKADKKMPANEKKEALAEIDAAMKAASSEKPLPGNVDLVKANMSKLDQAQKGE